MTTNQTFTPNDKIGKGTAVKGKHKKGGGTYDRIDGYVVHPDTGEKLGILIFIASEQASFIHPKTNTKILKKDKEGSPQYEVSILLKGKWNENVKRYEKFTPKFKLETKKKVQEVQTTTDDIGF